MFQQMLQKFWNTEVVCDLNIHDSNRIVPIDYLVVNDVWLL